MWRLVDYKDPLLVQYDVRSLPFSWCAPDLVHGRAGHSGCLDNLHASLSELTALPVTMATAEGGMHACAVEAYGVAWPGSICYTEPSAARFGTERTKTLFVQLGMQEGSP